MHYCATTVVVHAMETLVFFSKQIWALLIHSLRREDLRIKGGGSSDELTEKRMEWNQQELSISLTAEEP